MALKKADKKPAAKTTVPVVAKKKRKALLPWSRSRKQRQQLKEARVLAGEAHSRAGAERAANHHAPPTHKVHRARGRLMRRNENPEVRAWQERLAADAEARAAAARSAAALGDAAC